MNKKFMKVKKVVIPVLTLGALLAQSTMALAVNLGEIADLSADSQYVELELAEQGGNIVYAANEENHEGEKRPTSEVYEITFTDVKEGAWYYNNVMDLVDRGVINGYGDGTFKPDNNITRAEFTKLVMTALGSTAIKENTLGWPNNVISAATKTDINLYGDSVEAWNEKINRADMAQIAMDAMYEIRGKVVSPKDNMANVLLDRADVENSSRKDAILKAMSVGILNGNGTDENGYTSYLPNNNTRRSEAATIIMNMLKYLGDEEGELNPIAVPEKPAVEKVMPDILEVGSTRVPNPEIAREKDLEALKNTRCGKDETGYFIQFTAPDLPQTLKDANYKFVFYADATPKMVTTGKPVYALSPVWTIMDAGETRKFYFRVAGEREPAKDTDASIAGISLTVAIRDYSSVLDEVERIKNDPSYIYDNYLKRELDGASFSSTEAFSHSMSSESTVVRESGEYVGYTNEDGMTHNDNWKLHMDREDVLKIFDGLMDIMIENAK